MGGEKAMSVTPINESSGSPPRGRGKDVLPCGKVNSSRITPARAGKRSTGPPLTQTTVDHPRVGGEKISFFFTGCSPRGSPPRGRGKGIQLTHKGLLDGITPAWAGKRFWNRPWVWATSDHPRMGGEKSFDQACTGVVEGSPPHGRGKDVRQVGAVCGRGITPAWAGKRPRT